MADFNHWGSAAQALPSSMTIDCEVKHNALKRTFDILFSLTVLVLSIPLLAIISVAILISSKGKVVYAHERIGRGGKPFRCYKFRTMYPDADDRLKDILKSSPDLRKEWEQSQKIKNDPRVTPIGKFLRKTSLDEFPQFFNVIKGDLSVVGPRPVVRSEVTNHLGPKAAIILSIRPGLTGLWQVSGRSDTTYSKRIQLDEQYVKNQSMLLDLKLIAKTLPSMISSNGAY